jgi:imidazolonepropionase
MIQTDPAEIRRISAMSPNLTLIHARVCSCADDAADVIDDAFVAIRDGRIDGFGPMAALASSGVPSIDCGHRLLTPGLIDCHTHLVHAGDRSREFEQRLQGASYEQIARAGGGIQATVRATRAASAAELEAQSRRRAQRLQAGGVTLVEIKSGYGLDLEQEMKSLAVARRLATPALEVVTTCLAAHAVPPEFAGRADDYIAQVCDVILPAVAAAGLADAVDAFCETIAFTPAQVRRVFDRARALGLPVKLHAEQLSDQGGAQLAAAYGALSCDHLEYLSPAGVAAMAVAGTVAVLLPGAFYTLREQQLPPIAQLRAQRVPIALATDCNPGTSPTTSLVRMLNLACTMFRLTPVEALLGVTREAARALGRGATHGIIAPGRAADLVLWDADAPASLAYPLDAPSPLAIYKGGVRTDTIAALAR